MRENNYCMPPLSKAFPGFIKVITGREQASSLLVSSMLNACEFLCQLTDCLMNTYNTVAHVMYLTWNQHTANLHSTYEYYAKCTLQDYIYIVL